MAIAVTAAVPVRRLCRKRSERQTDKRATPNQGKKEADCLYSPDCLSDRLVRPISPIEYNQLLG